MAIRPDKAKANEANAEGAEAPMDGPGPGPDMLGEREFMGSRDANPSAKWHARGGGGKRSKLKGAILDSQGESSRRADQSGYLK